MGPKTRSLRAYLDAAGPPQGQISKIHHPIPVNVRTHAPLPLTTIRTQPVSRHCPNVLQIIARYPDYPHPAELLPAKKHAFAHLPEQDPPLMQKTPHALRTSDI
jgi:hypothetical protein